MVKRLKNTFIHIPQVGEKTEKKIWKSNILDWHQFLEKRSNLPASTHRRISSHIERSISAYEKQDHTHFFGLPESEHWRAYDDFKNNCAFLDIETTGLSKYYSKITTIGIYNGNKSKIFIRGQNLEHFPEEIKKYNMLVTFNGKCFDLPFIEHSFPSINFNQFHIDLRYIMARLGYSGGLKLIETQLGIDRKDLRDVDGREAVRLWNRYQRGDRQALELLVRYNIADVENLKILMDYAYGNLKEKKFLSVVKPTDF